MRSADRRVRKALPVLIALAIAGSCATGLQKNISPQNLATQAGSTAFCDVAKRMSWAARDTVETRNQIRDFNALVAKNCSRAGGTSDGR